MDDKITEIAMELIFFAGNAKSDALRAINISENGDNREAKILIESAKKQLHDAHQIQTGLITQEINGKIIEKSIILIHAQDHFISAVTSIDLGEKIINMNERLFQIEKKVNRG